MLPEAIEQLIRQLGKLPTIGRKSAQRLTLHLLRQPEMDLAELGNAVLNLKKGITFCTDCFNFAEEDSPDGLCSFCSNERRDQGLLCVVEDVLDVIAVENSNEYRGLYHVLHGHLSPLDGVGPDQLKIRELLERLSRHEGIEEIILATGTSMEGEATAAYIADLVAASDVADRVRVTRISQGMPIGGELDYADSLTLRRALTGRREF